MPFLQDVSTTHYAIAHVGAFCLGFSKAGFPGLAIVNVLLSKAEVGAKVLWTVLLLIIPLISLIVWFFIGPRKA